MRYHLADPAAVGGVAGRGNPVAPVFLRSNAWRLI
jgi:hypothetical protein